MKDLKNLKKYEQKAASPYFLKYGINTNILVFYIRIFAFFPSRLWPLFSFRDVRERKGRRKKKKDERKEVKKFRKFCLSLRKVVLARSAEVNPEVTTFRRLIRQPRPPPPPLAAARRPPPPWRLGTRRSSRSW